MYANRPLQRFWWYLLLPWLLVTSACAEQEDPDRWQALLDQRLRVLAGEAPGELGVYVKRVREEEAVSIGAEQRWYLASTVKVPVAIVLLELVEEGEITLDEALVLQDDVRVDGAGELIWQQTGGRYDVGDLLERMVTHSDNTAADMLISRIGVERLNQRLSTIGDRLGIGAPGFGPITTLAEVRYQVYRRLHPDAAGLDRQQLAEIAAAAIGPRRVDAVARALGVERAELELDDIDAAYADYYAQGDNSAALADVARLFEGLVEGELLNSEHRALLYRLMKIDRYEAYRLEGGLDETTEFIHKTGTQRERACHAGVIDPSDPERAIVVIACTQDMDEASPSETLLEQVGASIEEILVAPERQS
ncbi:serine hydrolase [Halotalea alkalilenta]|uniref:Beta-lactamase class A catalytic domain-containing protein n=1 Tax=Halotalea alkalilenta TaxID=376489 RepID=A0A172YJ61_9GAMM|nr:serine hydrolase [Halotalea alkalilenta]ANF59202.1 hypothetical protein A5892_18475 [Halotalea alkalilenta]